MRVLILIILIFSGCAWWQAGVNDPEIVAEAIKTSATYKDIAEATGLPYAKMVAGSLAVFMTILFKGRKKVKR